MDRRAELKLKYKEMKKPMGVFQIKSRANGKILVGSSSDLDSMKNRIMFQLKYGSSMNRELQEDWKKYGEDNFSFEVLEYLEPLDDETWDPNRDLKELEEIYLEKLQPFNDRGYNRKR